MQHNLTMRPGIILAVLSVGLNIALAALGFHLAKPPATVLPRSSNSMVEAVSVVVAPPVITAAAAKTPVVFTYTTNAFRWAKLEAEDWTQFAANLRAVGCPEKTVRDILFARAKRLLGEDDEILRERLRPALGRDADLFGSAPGIFWLRSEMEFDEQALGKFLCGPMPEDTFQRLVVMMERDRKLGRDLDEHFKTSTNLLAGKKQELAAQMHRDVTGLLTASQLEELTARMQVDLIHKSEWEVTCQTIGLSAVEFRQLMVICARLHDPLVESVDLTEKPDDLDERFQAAMRAWLGPQRYALYERGQDTHFQEIYRTSKSEAWPPATRDRVYEIQKFAEQESRALNDDASLTKDGRYQLRQQMQADVQQAVAAVLSEKAWGDYLKQNSARWMTNLAKP
jgi:hypothetical protein